MYFFASLQKSPSRLNFLPFRFFICCPFCLFFLFFRKTSLRKRALRDTSHKEVSLAAFISIYNAIASYSYCTSRNINKLMMFICVICWFYLN